MSCTLPDPRAREKYLDDTVYNGSSEAEQQLTTSY
jgi:hypothetical protein